MELQGGEGVPEGVLGLVGLLVLLAEGCQGGLLVAGELQQGFEGQVVVQLGQVLHSIDLAQLGNKLGRTLQIPLQLNLAPARLGNPVHEQPLPPDQAPDQLVGSLQLPLHLSPLAPTQLLLDNLLFRHLRDVQPQGFGFVLGVPELL